MGRWTGHDRRESKVKPRQPSSQLRPMRKLRPARLGYILSLPVVLMAACGPARHREGEARSGVNESLEELEELCRRQKVLPLGDLGVWHCYAPSTELQEVVARIAASGDARNLIMRRYGRCASTDWESLSVETVFPLLDVLLRTEKIVGSSTETQRDQLWATWHARFGLEMRTMYGSTRATYESDIQRLPALGTSRPEPR